MTDISSQSEFAKETIPVTLEEEMRRSYLDYAMSVIVGRALPDVRDGLKPVHRRVLYAMHELNNDWNRAYKKSARIVGDVIGKYHPHGDSAVYDTIVRLAQPFSMRYMLVDGQGNFGSVDGDAPAAMRYTEIRMARIAHEMLTDIDKETVNFGPNYDGSEHEPLVLPTRLPALLINGSAGIAVGMATNIPPHNLNETVDATLALLGNENLSVDELIEYLPAPDFPTGGTIYGIAGVREGYRTGRGRVIMRGKTHIETIGKNNEREAIIIDEIPYQVNKAKLCEKIGALVREKIIEDISELRDESDKSGMRVVIELKRGANADVVLNNLYKLTQLQDTFGINMVALVDGRPCLLNLKQILSEFLRHRREVVTRRTIYELRKARERGHILEGLAVALSNVDEIIALIKASATPPEAKAALLSRPWQSALVREMLVRSSIDATQVQPDGLPENLGLQNDGYHLSEAQAQAILDMRLQRLTGLEQDKIIDEYKEIMAHIMDLIDILAKKERVNAIIAEELVAIKNQFGDARRTEINTTGADIDDEDLIPQRDMIVTLSHQGYIKTQATDEYRAQKRGGKGKLAAATKDEDFIDNLFVANSHDYLMCFTNQGRCHWIKVYRLPEGKSNSKGRPINNFIQLDEGEKVNTILPVREFSDDHFVVFATQNGVVKKVRLSAFENVRAKGIKAIALKDNDLLIGAAITDGMSDIMLFSDMGKMVRFNEYYAKQNQLDDDEEESDETASTEEMEDGEEITSPFKGNGLRPSGRGTGGLRGMRLPENAKIVSLLVASPEDENNLQILTATENGYGKRTPIVEYGRKNKGGQGMIAINTSERNGALIGAVLVGQNDDIMLITDSGILIRASAQHISQTGRNAQGVRLIRLDDDAKLIGIERVCEENSDEDESEENAE
ncbi:MAG: DNA gyrase subunit A [Neisseriaceae bacterium]|nr:DNA gyrase subunit A [Neisseriaceae bacterium]